MVDYMINSHNKQPSPQTMLAHKSASQFEPQDKHDEAWQIDVLDGMNKYLKSRQDIQEQYNQFALENDGKSFDTVKHAVKSVGYMMLPFMQGSLGAKIYNENPENDDHVINQLWGMIQPGSVDKKNVDYYRHLPADQAAVAHKQLFEALSSTNLNIVTNDNSFAAMQKARQIVMDGYTDEEATKDNLFGLLDLAGVVMGVPRTINTAVKLAHRVSGTEDAVRTLNVKGNIDQNSTGVIYEDTNPDKFRAAANAAVDNEDAAKALFNSDSRTVAAHYALPNVTSSENGGWIVGKQPIMDPTIEAAKSELVRSYARASLQGASDANIQSALDTHLEELKNVSGVVPRVGEFSHHMNDDGSFTFNAVYGTMNGGWDDPKVAEDTVKQALRHLGLPDNAFTVNEK